jgi:hypothetical protein
LVADCRIGEKSCITLHTIELVNSWWLYSCNIIIKVLPKRCMKTGTMYH